MLRWASADGHFFAIFCSFLRFFPLFWRQFPREKNGTVFTAENAEDAEGKRQFQVPGSEFQVNGKRQQTSAEDADGRRWMRGKGTAGRGTVQAEGLGEQSLGLP